MRSLMIVPVALAALGLAACGSDESTQQAANGTQDVTVESIGGNDTTAIDAATAADANMAADVDYNAIDLNELDEAADEDNGSEE